MAPSPDVICDCHVVEKGLEAADRSDDGGVVGEQELSPRRRVGGGDPGEVAEAARGQFEGGRVISGRCHEGRCQNLREMADGSYCSVVMQRLPSGSVWRPWTE